MVTELLINILIYIFLNACTQETIYKSVFLDFPRAELTSFQNSFTSLQKLSKNCLLYLFLHYFLFLTMSFFSSLLFTLLKVLSRLHNIICTKLILSLVSFIGQLVRPRHFLLMYFSADILIPPFRSNLSTFRSS